MVSFVYFHELQHVEIYKEYGVKSYIVLSDFGLHGHTYPINIHCLDVNCVEIGEQHDILDRAI